MGKQNHEEIFSKYFFKPLDKEIILVYNIIVGSTYRVFTPIGCWVTAEVSGLRRLSFLCAR